MPTTFQVSEKAAKAIGERITKTASIAENLQGLLGAPVEASGANASVVIGMKLNGLISAVHTAFGKHFPLVLSPDDIWLALAQGFALHVEANAEALQYATKAKLSEGYHGPNTASFPPGLAKVPFVWDYLGVEFNYEFLGGFVGAHQEETLAVRPAIGWAVREVPAAP